MRLFNSIKPGALIRCALAGLLCLCPFSPAGRVQAEDVEFNRYVDALAAQIAVSAVQRSGYVVYIRSNEIYLDIGVSAGGKVGQEWDVIREISDIPHPVSGEIIGRSEQTLGKVMINRVREKLAIATPISPLTAEKVKIGDRVYLASRQRKIAVMRLVGESAEVIPFYSIMSDIFVHALTKQPGLEILPPDDVEATLKKFEDIDLSNYNGFLTRKTIMKIGKLLGVDGILLGNIFKGKDKYLLNVRLMDTKQGKAVQIFEQYIPETEGIKAFVSLRPSSASQQGEFVRQLVKIGEEDFDFPIFAQSLRDVDLDNQPELVVLTPGQLRFLNWDGLFFNEERVLEINSPGDISLFSREKLGNLVIADINRNRSPEIYYSLGNMRLGEMVEWDGKFFLKSSLTYYHPLTAYRGEGANHLVMGHYLGTRNYFQGKDMKEISRGGSFSRIIDNTLNLPKDFYQVVCGDIDRDGKNEWLIVDPDDRINVYNQDLTLRWQSTPLFGLALSLVDVDSDGQQEVGVSSNALPGEEDRFFVLKWDGIGLSKLFESPLLAGSIYNLCGGDIDGDKEAEIIISLSDIDYPEISDNSRLQIYKIK